MCFEDNVVVTIDGKIFVAVSEWIPVATNKIIYTDGLFFSVKKLDGSTDGIYEAKLFGWGAAEKPAITHYKKWRDRTPVKSDVTDVSWIARPIPSPITAPLAAPVPVDTFVQVLLRDGTISEYHTAIYFEWGEIGDATIVAYRPHPKEVTLITAKAFNDGWTTKKTGIDPINDHINHPKHYGGDTVYEAIKVIEAWRLGFALGNAIKYIARAGKKDRAKTIEDLEKAAWYLKHEIDRRRREIKEAE